jgi:hypothetical protein
MLLFFCSLSIGISFVNGEFMDAYTTMLILDPSHQVCDSGDYSSVGLEGKFPKSALLIADFGVAGCNKCHMALHATSCTCCACFFCGCNLIWVARPTQDGTQSVAASRGCSNGVTARARLVNKQAQRPAMV